MLQIFCTIIEESSILNSEWSICASTYKTLQGYIGVAHTGDSSSSDSSNEADWLLKWSHDGATEYFTETDKVI